MNGSDLQAWLNWHGANIAVDGQPGPATRDALKAAFVNLQAPAVGFRDILRISHECGCSLHQMGAVSIVEGAGVSYDNNGRPKMLYERHKFSKWTNHAYDTTSYSNPDSGGYNEDSWEKLAQGACKDVEAAFKSCSWGLFQVLGEWYPYMGFSSALEMAYSTVINEANHYNLFAGYIKLANLTPALRKVSTNPDDNRDFAEGYNGPSYEEYNYHVKIADAMVDLEGQYMLRP